MRKNKNNQSAFKFFMLEWKQQEERKGQRFPNGIIDVQADPACHEAWKNLSAQEKNVFKEKEKDYKIQPKIEKKTSAGESMDEIAKVDMMEKKFHSDMIKYITSTIEEYKTTNAVDTMKFYAIHVNYYYMRQHESNVQYYPAEIGIAEFSLKEGITNTYNTIFTPIIMKGYAHAAKEYSSNTHQIPIFVNSDFGEDDYEKVCKEIYEFLKPGCVNNKLPPLYTVYGVEHIKYPVKQFIEKLSSYDEEHFRGLNVYSFEELFMRLYNMNNEKGFQSMDLDIPMISIKLKKDPYDFKKSIQCDYHQAANAGGNFCSLSVVQRWIFELCKDCCDLFDIALVPGSHIPRETGETELDRTLNDSFSALNFNGYSASGSTKPTGAVKNPPMVKHRSERTHEDERRRRQEFKPLSIVIHGNVDAVPQEILLKAEKKPAAASAWTKPPQSVGSAWARPQAQRVEGPDSVALNDNNFPSIGRGAAIRSKVRQNDPSSTSYASRFK